MEDHAPGAAPLIGTDDVETPPWARGYELTSRAGVRAVARSAVRTAALVIRWSWRAAPVLTVLTGVVQLVAGAVTAFGLLATASVFTSLLEEGPTPERVVAALPSLVLVVAAYAGRGLLDAAVGAVQSDLAPRVELRAREDLHAAVLDVDLVAFDDADFTELVERVAQQSIDRIRVATRATGDLLASLVTMVAAVVAAGLLHPLLAPLMLLVAVPQGWASIIEARMSLGSWVRMLSNRRRLGVASDLLTDRGSAGEVRAYTAQQVLLAEHRRIATRLMIEEVALGRRRTLVQLAGRALTGVGTALAFAVLGLLIYNGVLPLALAGAAALAMRVASQAVSATVMETDQLFEAGYYVELYRACLDDARTRGRAAPSATVVADPEVIELAGVTFRYPGGTEPAIEELTAVLRRGEIVALVGENGSGKSTLAKLITGLYLPECGTVTWDGVDIATVDPDDLLGRVALVLQDPVRWPMTAENNVRIGRLERLDPGGEARDAAARDSGADGVVSELPEGWATVLSREFQSGRDLSGGQWQRLAVARGLYRDAPLVIADEPTAALDARAEHAVFGTLHGRSGAGTERITLLVTHRLANVRYADQILVLDHGRLIEHGCHDELMALRGTYWELFSLQARAYADGTESVQLDRG